MLATPSELECSCSFSALRSADPFLKNIPVTIPMPSVATLPGAALSPAASAPPSRPPVGFTIKTEEELIAQQLRDIEESMSRRLEHLIAVERGGPRAIELELAICAEDWKYWMGWYAFTYDPRNPLQGLPSFLPFDLCQRQIELWEWFDYILTCRQDGATKKSRGVGFTWEAGSYAWHKWRFVPGFKTTFGSRKATEVDQIGNPDSIFEKIRLFYRGLPRWMWPAGFNPNLHDKQMLMMNPENDNTIRGEGGEEMGRGGRSTLYIIDEAATVEHADRVEAATSANCDARIWGSTINPRNENNFFARKYSSLPADRVFRFHYSEHPIWTPGRIAKKKQDCSDEVWAAEFEIDDSYVVEDITIPSSWVQSSIKLKGLLDESVRILTEQSQALQAQANAAQAAGSTKQAALYREAAHDKLTEAAKYKLEPHATGVAGGDVGGGKAQSVVVGRFGPVVTIPKAWGNPDTTDTALKMLDFCVETKLPPREDGWEPKITALRFDAVAIGQGVSSTMKRNPREGLTVAGINTGDPASDTRWADGFRGHEKFFNMKAEGWWIAREMFKKTHEMVLWLLGESDENGAKEHPIDELLVMPNKPNDPHVQRLVTQLSQPKWHRRENGKIQLETKEQLSKRQVPSPDYADAFILTLVKASKAEKWAKFAHVTV